MTADVRRVESRREVVARALKRIHGEGPGPCSPCDADAAAILAALDEHEQGRMDATIEAGVFAIDERFGGAPPHGLSWREWAVQGAVAAALAAREETEE